MPKTRDVWQQYVEAARRKLAIAAYHADALEKQHFPEPGSSKDMPTISVQAHFEGVIVSVISAVDQVAQAINSALRLRLKTDKLVEDAFNRLAESAPEIGSWYSESIGRDLRRIRVRMVHYRYFKNEQFDGWVVESAGTDFQGPRELIAYARNAVEYGERLGSLLPLIEAKIATRPGGGSTVERDEPA
jgi:hypothetical protein